MNRSFLALAVFLMIALATTSVFAKRAPPKEVPVVRHGDLEYRVRHHVGNGSMPGFVEAWDTSKKSQVWLRQIYVIRRNLDLEEDLQDVFITGIKLINEHKALEITNETGNVFELNLETLDVKAIQGRTLHVIK
jgi:hypothetical protein